MLEFHVAQSTLGKTGGRIIVGQSDVILITLVLYKLTLLGIGVWSKSRVHDNTDFLLGGRNLGPWVAGLSYAASTSSAWVLLGFSGFVFSFGIAALWMVPGIWAGYVVMWLWFGPRIREESKANDWVTPTDFLCAKLDKRAAYRIAAVSAVLITFCFIFYIAAQFDAAATAFAVNFDTGHVTSLLLGAGIILVYCLLGGFWAASVTDMLQAIVMLGAAVVVSILSVMAAGGPAAILNDLAAADPGLLDITGGTAGFLFAGLALGLAGIGLGTLGQPQLVARLMAVKGDRERRLGFMIAFTWGVGIYIGMSWLALAARSMALEPGAGEQIFYLLAADLLPPVLAGIVIAAILSAVMSTVDSLLLAASAAIAHDLRLGETGGHDRLRVSRLVMTAIVIAAVVLAVFLPETIFNRVLFAWNALGAAFGPLIIARVAGIEPSARARLWSILSGFGLTVFFYSLGNVDDAAAVPIIDWLVGLAKLPGDPFERFIPFLPPLLIVLWPGKGRIRHSPSDDESFKANISR